MNVLIDLPLMIAGPMRMSLAEYSADIGLTCLIMPVVTSAIGFACPRAGAVAGTNGEG